MSRYIFAALVAALVVPIGTAQNRPRTQAPSPFPARVIDVKPAEALPAPAVRFSSEDEAKPDRPVPAASAAPVKIAEPAGTPALRGGSSATAQGTTTGRPTWQRPVCSTFFPINPTTQCTTTGPVTTWEEHAVQINTAGDYTITTTYNGYDGYVYLYRGDFDPPSPRVGLIGLDDDFTGTGNSRLEVALTAGNYTVVESSFNADVSGDYSVEVATAAAGATFSIVRNADPAFDLTPVTTSEGTFQRPDCNVVYPTTPATQCQLGGNVAYTSVQVMSFENTLYQIRSTQTGRDGYLFVYKGGFDPQNPLDNLIAAADDDYSTRSSEATLALRTSETLASGDPVGFYTVVAANFSTTDANQQTLEFRGTRLSRGSSAFMENAIFQALDTGEITASDPTMAYVSCTVEYPTAPATQCTADETNQLRYDAVQFTPTGTITDVPLTQTQQFDGVLMVYRGSFNPAAPLQNLIARNDDGSGGIGTSDVYVGLVPNTKYVLVTQQYTATETGRYVTAAHVYRDQMDITFQLFVDAEAPASASAFDVSPLAPNPTSSSARVRLTTPGGDVHVAVYDALGRQVAVLAQGDLAPGSHTFTVDATALAPGAYVIRAVAGADVATQMLTVVR